MKGAPAKPIKGTRSRSAFRVRVTDSARKGDATAGSGTGRAVTAASSRTGRASTGAGLNSSPSPMASRGMVRSEKRIAASRS